ncbi:alpha/beta hydrolase [Roseisolibacter sp. H3M3-2]|uniref:alpha/beta hydrolase n=1 Tax=Roseisolibacter sp. H3M3-2 TaxID=3031323 RepID=UPI0023D99EFF|nr:alpha/beta hydrolase [Roseisolibacter sp. H3M3-2]MDF1505054.1 alpha/beta hydrolase [Roseisolibacter sp. H3M3-2]
MRALRLAALLTLAGCAGRAPAPASAPVAGAGAGRVDTGSIGGARYRVQLPARWNGGLVMYAHGYRFLDAPPARWDDRAEQALRDTVLARGFAIAESQYRRQGWAVAEGVEDTEALRRHFVARHGRPRETVMLGHSMGGLIAVLTLERHPDAYTAGLPVCGVLTPAPLLARMVEVLAAADVLAPGVLRDGAAGLLGPVPAGLADSAVAAALARVPGATARVAAQMELRERDVPWVLAFARQLVADLRAASGGLPFGNADVVYAGWGDDAAMNRAVRRYPGDPAATAWLLARASPTGALRVPTLAVHTTYDELVPARSPNEYRLAAARAGARDRFVQAWVEADGHCNVSPARTGRALDQLLAWAREGRRPAGGELR